MAASQPISSGPHGHPNPIYLGRYMAGCRCGECVEARRRWGREHYARAVRGRRTATEKAKYAARSRAILATRRAMLAGIKHARGCADCGYNAHPAALDFDHVRGEKFTEVSVMGTLAAERIEAEVAKCDVVCYRCHRIRTRARMQAGESSWVRKRVENPSPNTLRMARYRQRGWAYLSAIKTASGCADCGYRGPSEAMDFDHVRGVKEFNISQRPQYPITRLESEVAKCDVVCANCHRVRTYNRRRGQAAPE